MLQSDAIRFLDVTCAIIFDGQRRVLCALRGSKMSNPGKWEFPGGKLEANEDIETCVRREILEEMGVEIEVSAFGPAFVSVHDSNRILRLHALCGKVVAGELVPAEHQEIRWVKLERLPDLDWQLADVPIVEWLMASASR